MWDSKKLNMLELLIARVIPSDLSRLSRPYSRTCPYVYRKSLLKVSFVNCMGVSITLNVSIVWINNTISCKCCFVCWEQLLNKVRFLSTFVADLSTKVNSTWRIFKFSMLDSYVLGSKFVFIEFSIPHGMVKLLLDKIIVWCTRSVFWPPRSLEQGWNLPFFRRWTTATKILWLGSLRPGNVSWYKRWAIR
mgnify:CR=1 FL=1